MNVIRSVTGTTTAPIPMRGKFQTIISQLLLFVPRIAGQQQQLTTSSSSNQPYFVSLPFLIIKTCILALKFAESNDGCIRAGAAFPGSSCRDTFVCATSNNAFSLLTILPYPRLAHTESKCSSTAQFSEVRRRRITVFFGSVLVLCPVPCPSCLKLVGLLYFLPQIRTHQPNIHRRQ